MQRAFRQAGSETRLVHPFASHHYRQPASGDIQTDDTDLEAIFRAAVNGFGLLEAPLDETYQRLQILVRYRRDLVEKRAKLQCQIRECLERCLPGYAALFPRDDLWQASVGLWVARRATGTDAQRWSSAAIREAGVSGITRWLREAKLQFWTRTVEKVVAWSGNAAEADPLAAQIAQVWHELYADWQQKTTRIRLLERELAQILVKTPYLLLLSHPGINVVSASDLAGGHRRAAVVGDRSSMTRIPRRSPAGRASFLRAIKAMRSIAPTVRWPGSAMLDSALPAGTDRRLVGMADCLIKCNAHFRGKSELWKRQGVDARDIRCRVANRAVRTVFQMVSGRRLDHHPSRLDRDYVLDKLLEFHQQHHAPPHEILRDLKRAAEQIPPPEQAAEAAPLRERYHKCRRSRRERSQPIGAILLAVLAWDVASKARNHRTRIERRSSRPGTAAQRWSRPSRTRAPDNVVGAHGQCHAAASPR